MNLSKDYLMIIWKSAFSLYIILTRSSKFSKFSFARAKRQIGCNNGDKGSGDIAKV